MQLKQLNDDEKNKIICFKIKHKKLVYIFDADSVR